MLLPWWVDTICAALLNLTQPVGHGNRHTWYSFLGRTMWHNHLTNCTWKLSHIFNLESSDLWQRWKVILLSYRGFSLVSSLIYLLWCFSLKSFSGLWLFPQRLWALVKFIHMWEKLKRCLSWAMWGQSFLQGTTKRWLQREQDREHTWSNK